MQKKLPDISKQVHSETILKFFDEHYPDIAPIWASIQLEWINNIYKENFSSEISSNWIKNPIAENIKKEFIENAKCIDARAYDAFLIT